MTDSTDLDRAIAGLPRAHPGPGGAVAVIRHGEVLARHAWGWANAERRIPFTPRTLFRMCSITKQFTCAAVLDAFPDPTALDGDVRARLPLLDRPAPGALHLCHNQSGLRDYWAVAMLHGSPAEAPFGDADAARVIGGTRTLHFPPGAQYSYSNNNFRILSDILQDRSDRPFADLLRPLFDRAGMASAFLAADTRAMPDGTEGYEGSAATGFRPAVNQVIWTGDAGLGASLDDMIAWEQFIDRTRDDAASVYRRLSAAVAFADGAPADYGFGLNRRHVFGRPATGHGGALRGWVSHRLNLPSERLSVVVLFNHMADARAAALDIVAAVLGEAVPKPNPALPAPDWLGAYLDEATGLSARLDVPAPGEVRLRYGHSAERLPLQHDGSAGLDGNRLAAVAGGLQMHRPGENTVTLLRPHPGPSASDLSGRYRCAELDAELTIADAGGALYGAVSGMLGQGRMEQLDPIGHDLWALPCSRALDHTPPGDWTLRARRDDTGRVTGVQLGCWLARGLTYERHG